MPGLTRKSFEKYGFSTAALLTDWPRIVGAELAGATVPERLKWPRATETLEDEATRTGREGATLVLRVDPALALEVEYRGRQIVERINAFFGYGAVAELRLLQAPIEPRPRSPAAADQEARDTAPVEAAAADRDGALRVALLRLERQVLGARRRAGAIA